MLLSIVRTLIFYSLLMVVIRLLGKRQLGEMEPSEFVVTMLLANLATIPIEVLDGSVLYGILPIAIVFLLEYTMSVLTLGNIRIRKLFCGKPVILIENGKISQKNLRRTRITLDELTMHLREKNIFDLTTVKFAILETNGQVSALLYAKDSPVCARDAKVEAKDTELPITLISDGHLLKNNLSLTKKDEGWLEMELKKRRIAQKDVLLFTVDTLGHIYFVPKQE